MSKQLAIVSWEIGKSNKDWGTSIGDTGLAVEMISAEMLKYSAAKGLSKDLSIEILSPYFQSYDRRNLVPEILPIPIFNTKFEIYSHISKGIKYLYFRNVDESKNFQEPYPQKYSIENLQMTACVNFAMATYINKKKYDAIHIHDYHVGLVPFYLDFQEKFLSIVFTIHNANQQGWIELDNYSIEDVMEKIKLPKGYANDFKGFNGLRGISNFNFMKGIRIFLEKIHQGKKANISITTVSENYAKELKLSVEDIKKLCEIKGLPIPQQPAVANMYLNELATCKPEIIGITHGFNPSYLIPIHEIKCPPTKAEHIYRDKDFLGKEDLNLVICFHVGICEHTLNIFPKRRSMRNLIYKGLFKKEAEDRDITISLYLSLEDFGFISELLRKFSENVLKEKWERIHFIILLLPDQGLNKLRKKIEELPNQEQIKYLEWDTILSKVVFTGSDFFLIPRQSEPCGWDDYEAAKAGCIPIVRRTGGLTKTSPFSLEYEWYDQSPTGRLQEIKEIVKVLHRAIELFDLSDDDIKKMREAQDVQMLQDMGDIEIIKRIRGCMQINTSWESAILQYFQLLNIK